MIVSTISHRINEWKFLNSSSLVRHFLLPFFYFHPIIIWNSKTFRQYVCSKKKSWPNLLTKRISPEQGLEPWTFRLKAWRSTNWATRASWDGRLESKKTKWIQILGNGFKFVRNRWNLCTILYSFAKTVQFLIQGWSISTSLLKKLIIFFYEIVNF